MLQPAPPYFAWEEAKERRPGCYSTIAEAIATAAPLDTITVRPGLYKEAVVITKPLSLVGNEVTIDATGLSQRIFVNGLATPGLAGVNVSGFTVRNANFEGILVLNASAVTISTNRVLANTIEGNAGGILLSDDTGATHDNLVSFNTVRNNPYACGITMASHVQASVSGSLVPLGVYHNTIYANLSSHNGYGVGGGSGIGIFASVPNAKS